MKKLFRIYGIFFIILIALILRLGAFLYIQLSNPDVMWLSDSYGYQRLAVNLLQNHAFSFSESTPFEPDIYRTPGYPAMMAGIYSVFGIRPAFVTAFQIIISLLTIFIVYELGVKLFNETSGLLAGFLIAIEPTSIYYSNTLLTKSAFSFALVLFAFLMVTIILDIEKITIAKIVLASLTLAIAILIKPIAYYLPIPVSIGLLIYLLKKRSLRKAIIYSVCFALIQLIIIGSWQVRNYVKTRCLEYTSVEAYTLLNYRAANVLREEKGISITEAQRQLVNNIYRGKTDPALSKSEILKAQKSEALKVIKEHPWTYAKLHIRGILIMFADPGITDIMRVFKLHKPDIAGSGVLSIAGINRFFVDYMLAHKLLLAFNLAGGIYLLLIYIAFIIGTYKPSSRLTFLSILFLLGIMLYFTLAVTPEAYSRFRSPIMPYILLIAGHGLSRIPELFRRLKVPHQA